MLPHSTQMWHYTGWGRRMRGGRGRRRRRRRKRGEGEEEDEEEGGEEEGEGKRGRERRRGRGVVPLWTDTCVMLLSNNSRDTHTSSHAVSLFVS